MRIAVTGHVDHGKSTVLGRLLADTGALPEGKLEQIRAYCERNARPFEYAFLLDALRDERAQGITIDVARVFFRSAKRHYAVYDTPGHVEFIRNMVTGASRADAALLVVDAAEGVRENTRRHATLLSMLGIRQVAVVVNKMDLLGYREEAHRAVAAALLEHLGRLGLQPTCCIPVAGREGEHLVRRTGLMPWYAGPTVLEALDAFAEARPAEELPFRMPVQDVYRFTAGGDDRRIVAGTVESGTARAGDEVVFHPSGKRARIRNLEAFPDAAMARLEAGGAGGFTLEPQIYVGRGEVAALAGQPAPATASRLRASLFWLGKRPLHRGRDYVLKLGTARVRARLEHLRHALDADTLEPREGAEELGRHEVGECVLALARPLAFDLDQLAPGTSRFVLVDDLEIAGGGIVLEGLPDAAPGKGAASRFGQRPTAVLLAGDPEDPDGPAAAEVAGALEDRGRAVHVPPTGPDPVRAAADASLLVSAGLVVLLPARSAAAALLAAEARARLGPAVRVAWQGAGEPPEGLGADVRIDPGDARGLVQAILDWTEPAHPDRPGPATGAPAPGSPVRPTRS